MDFSAKAILLKWRFYCRSTIVSSYIVTDNQLSWQGKKYALQSWNIIIIIIYFIIIIIITRPKKYLRFRAHGPKKEGR